MLGATIYHDSTMFTPCTATSCQLFRASNRRSIYTYDPYTHIYTVVHLTRFISLGFVLLVLRYPIISIFFALSDTFFTYSVVDILRD